MLPSLIKLIFIYQCLGNAVNAWSASDIAVTCYKIIDNSTGLPIPNVDLTAQIDLAKVTMLPALTLNKLTTNKPVVFIFNGQKTNLIQPVINAYVATDKFVVCAIWLQTFSVPNQNSCTSRSTILGRDSRAANKVRVWINDLRNLGVFKETTAQFIAGGCDIYFLALLTDRTARIDGYRIDRCTLLGPAGAYADVKSCVFSDTYWTNKKQTFKYWGAKQKLTTKLPSTVQFYLNGGSVQPGGSSNDYYNQYCYTKYAETVTLTKNETAFIATRCDKDKNPVIGTYCSSMVSTSHGYYVDRSAYGDCCATAT